MGLGSYHGPSPLRHLSFVGTGTFHRTCHSSHSTWVFPFLGSRRKRFTSLPTTIGVPLDLEIRVETKVLGSRRGGGDFL